jgi:hypothetical protein
MLLTVNPDTVCQLHELWLNRLTVPVVLHVISSGSFALPIAHPATVPEGWER